MTGALAIEETHTMLARSVFPAVFPSGKSQASMNCPLTASFTHADLVTADAIVRQLWSVMATPATAGIAAAVVLHRPVAVTGGQLGLNTITGYTSGGDYRAETLLYLRRRHARHLSGRIQA